VLLSVFSAGTFFFGPAFTERLLRSFVLRPAFPVFPAFAVFPAFSGRLVLSRFWFSDRPSGLRLASPLAALPRRRELPELLLSRRVFSARLSSERVLSVRLVSGLLVSEFLLSGLLLSGRPLAFRPPLFGAPESLRSDLPGRVSAFLAGSAGRETVSAHSSI
jgi:hypothetical protein